MNRPLKIVDIPATMEKFYGKGKMLHPDAEVIKEMICQIPKGKVTTIDHIAKKLATQYDVDVTCPMRTGNAVKKIAKNEMGITGMREIPFWRVVRKDLQFIKTGYETFCIQALTDEGITVVNRNKNIPKVTESKIHLYI